MNTQKVNILKDKNIYVINLKGEFTQQNYENKIKEIMENIRHINKLIFDCSSLSYINSSGIKLLIKVHKSLKNKNITLILSNVSDEFKDLFVFVGLHKLFKICDTIEDCSK
ncbi:anti-sigma F factor antagonist (plasmid) [Deferribacter desulfuricans SSM1]|uniref:Anti-sigma factor antagonist n=1 Tax=Deferribacter desulfuricans (strain DSM 14783 / JCM 11476 / NBRC 101012 / SSM1) TaxID=639282 RepID=D3PF08_DEFDS|nr:STAS domain-containing protein [Deferribacter desulfuricans]BAI81800.1 anti-sigma F factor antagonist [Deferribacter desulfuricans SSM1]